MRVDIEEIIKLNKRLREISQIDVREAEFYLHGKKIDIPEWVREDFSFTGLCITHFIKLGGYNEWHNEFTNEKGKIIEKQHWKRSGK